MKLSVIKLDGKAAGDVELSEAVFGISDIRGDLLARYVNWQLAKRRAGTRHTGKAAKQELLHRCLGV